METTTISKLYGNPEDTRGNVSVTQSDAMRGRQVLEEGLAESAYVSGKQDTLREVVNKLGGPLSNADQYGPTPQGVNVSDYEVQQLRAMGLPLTMDSVMLLRAPSANADQNPNGFVPIQ